MSEGGRMRCIPSVPALINPTGSYGSLFVRSSGGVAVPPPGTPRYRYPPPPVTPRWHEPELAQLDPSWLNLDAMGSPRVDAGRTLWGSKTRSWRWPALFL